MKKRWILILVLACAALLVAAASSSQAEGSVGAALAAPQAAVGTSFTYQGRLADGGSLANGEYDLRFRVYDAASGGIDLALDEYKDDVLITDGLFTVQLDFGNTIFTGDARWLEIAVRPGTSTGAYTTLTPRQGLTPAPYAMALPGLWTQQNATSPNLIGGYGGNSVTAGVHGATIGGGGSQGYPNQISANYATVGGGEGNDATGEYATVDGGRYNDAIGPYATVGGGAANEASGNDATVGGGASNQAADWYATVGGGYSNEASGNYATVGGGERNGATEDHATVGGGEGNDASGSGATIGGGYDNDAAGGYATVGGGYVNDASGGFATVPGGAYNVAQGDYSFAAGRRAQALHDGAIILADSNDFDFSSLSANTFKVRATGGIRFVLDIDGSSGAPTWSCLVQNGSSWSCSSDRNLKENLVLTDGSDVLERLSQMPVYYWNAKGQATPHIGPMAQDFYAAYGVGDSDTHISTIDLDGVALAAIQGLYAQNQELEQQNADLEARVAAVEQGGTSPASQPASTWLLPSGLAILVGVATPIARERIVVMKKKRNEQPPSEVI